MSTKEFTALLIIGFWIKERKYETFFGGGGMLATVSHDLKLHKNLRTANLFDNCDYSIQLCYKTLLVA